MIHVRVTGNRGSVKSVRISGHAYAGDPGMDLICAAVSSIGTGTMNALDEMVPDTCELKLNENIEIRVIQDSEKVQWILKTMLVQLETVAEKYPKNLEIDRKE